MSESQQTPDPRKALLQEICSKVPDPVPDVNAYGWAKLELLGHRVVYGYLDQVEFGASRVLRMRQPAQVDAEAELQLVEVARYSVSAMYGCTPLTKMQVISNLDWVRDQLAEIWHATRALPAAAASTTPAAEPCLSCGAPADAPCSPTCGDEDEDDDTAADDNPANSSPALEGVGL